MKMRMRREAPDEVLNGWLMISMRSETIMGCMRVGNRDDGAEVRMTWEVR